MTSKSTKAAFSGAHPAGIYADMTVDGPEIGTLVVIVDRAKNLPNRKTIGKQDPYCAARLGKEAKKTETDKRGGQTPRWDQELRFTVHDSPDYYQLKVSVFNDDKKTELIGETWVALEDIVIPGGGQNDRWHHLNCRGRFAGEIRIEITYYDTRPKEEKLEERRKETSVNGHQETREGLGGPRQHKPIKRRPLPADPTSSSENRPIMLNHSQSSPATSTPSKNQHMSKTQSQHIDQSMDYKFNTTPPSDLRHQQTHDYDRGSPLIYNAYNQEKQISRSNIASPNQFGISPKHEMYPHPMRESRHSNAVDWHQGTQEQQVFDEPLSYRERYHSSPQRSPAHDYHQSNHFQSPEPEDMYAKPPAQLPQESQIDPEHNSSPLPQPHSMPDVRSHPILETFDKQGQRYSLLNDESYEASPRNQALTTTQDVWSSPIPIGTEDESPPPPPTHRSTGLRSSPQTNERGNLDSYPPITAPAPLNIRTHRGSTSASPLSQVQSNVSQIDYPLSASPTTHAQGQESHYSYPLSISSSTTHQFSRSGASFSSHTSYSQPSRKQSQNNLAQSPSKDYVHTLPPSLVPGYEPSIAEEESQRILRERRMSNPPTHVNEPVPSYQAPTLYNPQTEPILPYQAHPIRDLQYEQSADQQSLPSRKIHPQTYTSSVSDSQVPLRHQEIPEVRRTHRSSVPNTKPRAVSPNPHTPVRKSVSPSPQASTEKRTSTIPFSPDSYDSLNPNLSAASSINSRGPCYSTPEQAREALHESQKEARLSEGPIIGSNGRVIDPSDHLPADTWAPEPETKQPRKGPEITLRFRHSPQNAQPIPLGARRPPHETSARSHTISNPVSTNSIDSHSPSSLAERSRFQPRSRNSPGQPASSPAVPTLHTARSRTSMPRASASDYPARRHNNYAYSNGSPVYARGLSNKDMPPPVPGKIPIMAGRAEEDWSQSALSEEMKRIDIGVGGGQPRSRRNRL